MEVEIWYYKKQVRQTQVTGGGGVKNGSRVAMITFLCSENDQNRLKNS